MSAVFDEQKLRFAFDDDWQVLKWDEHGAYVNGLRKFNATKAVDFFGLYIGAPWFVEVKDFRGYRVANQRRLSSGDLAKEVACKVRDTLASMVWACARTPVDPGEIGGFLRPLVNRSEKVPVMLWLEEDRPATPISASTLAEAIKRELGWLNARVIVASRALTQGKPIHGLEVTSLR